MTNMFSAAMIIKESLNDCSAHKLGRAIHTHACSHALMRALFSVSARLGKGQGAKEIGHNLARE